MKDNHLPRLPGSGAAHFGVTCHDLQVGFLCSGVGIMKAEKYVLSRYLPAFKQAGFLPGSDLGIVAH